MLEIDKANYSFRKSFLRRLSLTTCLYCHDLSKVYEGPSK